MKKCEVCSKPINSKKDTAKYCSPGCRQEAYRQRNGLERPAFIVQKSEKKKEVEIKTDTLLVEYLEKIEILNSEISELENKKDSYLRRIATAQTKRSLFGDTLETTKQVQNVAPKELNKFATIGGLALGFLSNYRNDYEEMRTKNNRKIRNYKLEIRELDEEINKKKEEKSLLQLQHDLLKEEFKKHFNNFLELKYKEETEKEEIKTKRLQSKVLNITDIQAIEYDTFQFNSEVTNLIGEPSKNFKMLVYGTSGNGKTTWTLNFSNMFANEFGSVLFNSSEEGISHSLRRKLIGYTSQNLFFSEAKEFEELKEILELKNYDLVVIDSLNDMEITKEQFNELQGFKNAFIFINQATKEGNYKGSTKFAHDSDIIIKIDNFMPEVEKTRFK